MAASRARLGSNQRRLISFLTLIACPLDAIGTGGYTLARKLEHSLIGSEPIRQSHEPGERMLESRLAGQLLVIMAGEGVREHPGHDLRQLREGGDRIVATARVP